MKTIKKMWYTEIWNKWFWLQGGTVLGTYTAYQNLDGLLKTGTLIVGMVTAIFLMIKMYHDMRKSVKGAKNQDNE